jgi:hypothetical protein
MEEKEQRELQNQEQKLFTDPIVTNHPYFMEKPLNTFLDEDAAMNINNSEMVYDPKEYE